MTRLKKGFLFLLAFVAIIASLLLWHLASIANGYSAKYLCTLTFNSNLDPDKVMNAYIIPMHLLFRGVRPEVDRINKTVTTKYFGMLRPRIAVWREGCGCTLLVNNTIDEIRRNNQPPKGIRNSDQPHKINKVWPVGNKVDRDSIKHPIDWDDIDKILDQAMVESENDFAKRDNTLALVVAWKGRIIGERYAEGVDEFSSLLGWSVTKSITGALVGVLVQNQGLDIHQPTGLPAWKNDGRNAITLDHLLRMESGLDFEEKYTPLADATKMLYASNDMGAFSATHKAKASPGERWCYSSGSSNIISDVLFDYVDNDPEKLHELAYQQFFNKLGITTAVFEHDESGSFVGSSYLSMSARDWLRVCLLYMNDGVWNGDRILPEGWVEYSLTPTLQSTDACYGAHIWLNASNDAGKRELPKLPPDTFMFKGFQEQWVVGIPSKGFMLARLGVTHEDDGWSPQEVILGILQLLENAQQ
jgi:CubicO group peptidase (beta-lactamase class C family)